MDVWMVMQYESYLQMVINLRNKTVKLQSCLYIELKLKIGLFKYFIKEFIDSTLLFSPVVWTFLGTEKREKRVIELTKSRTLLDYYSLSIKKIFLLGTKGRESKFKDFKNSIDNMILYHWYIILYDSYMTYDNK